MYFEAPEHWVTPGGMESIMLGAALGYLSAGQEEGVARDYTRETGNVLTLYSEKNSATAGGLLFVTYLGLGEGAVLTQQAIREMDPIERGELVAAARQGAEQTLRDLNASFLGAGQYEMAEAELVEINGLICFQANFNGKFSDGSWQHSGNVTCPIGSHLFRWETVYSSFSSEQEVEDVKYVSQSFRMKE